MPAPSISWLQRQPELCPLLTNLPYNNLLALGHELASNRKFDLAHMRRLAEALGNPQRKLQSVLIAGTNGKGSTAATLASIVADGWLSHRTLHLASSVARE